MEREDSVVVQRKGNEYVVINIHKFNYLKSKGYAEADAWRSSHTHVDKYDVAHVIRKNVTYNRVPKTNSYRLLESHYRVSSDPEYLLFIEDLMLSYKFKKGTRRKKRTTSTKTE